MDGITLYLSHACDNVCSRTIVLLSCDISPLCDVAQTSDCGVYSFLTLNISPLCDVAQTSDCGMHCLLFSVISPLCGVAPTPDCGIIIPHFPLEESFRHSFGTSIIIPHFPLEESFRHLFGTRITILQFPLEASFRPSLGTQYLLSLCLIALVNLFMCFMFVFVIPYVRTVLRVLS